MAASASASASGSSQRGLVLLSLDGGGIRGLSELLILEEIMARITSDEEQNGIDVGEALRPCEYFDLIGGTSTGGLIALMLGRLGMSVEQALQKYSQLTKDLFYRKQPFWRDGSYRAAGLAKAVRTTVNEYGKSKDDNEALLHEPNPCKIFLCATPARNIQVGRPRRLRSYRVRENRGYEGIKIWEAARATSAAPTYFKAIRIGPDKAREEEFIDAGVGCNNPIKQVLDEAKIAFSPESQVACVISIGTGIPKITNLQPPNALTKIIPLNAIKALADVATESQSVSDDVKQRFRNINSFYFRLNVDQGLQDVEMDEWEKRNEIVTHTRAYLERNTEVIDEIVSAILRRPHRMEASKIDGSVSSQELHLRYKVPLPNPLFTGREGVLDQMSQHFFERPENDTVGNNVFVLHGLGGIGKSQTAFAFARRFATKFVNCFYIDASNEDTLELGLTRVLPKDSPGASAAQAKLWLENQEDAHLVIFDNVDSRKLDLGKYIPRSNNVYIIITSRLKDMRLHAPRGNVDLPLFSDDESIDLLLSAAFLDLIDPHLRNLAEPIVKTLGHHPLAIAQAGSFISAHCRLESFLRLYEEQKKEIWARKPSQSIDNYKFSVFTTWEMSVSQLSPLAREFIQICSYFHNVGIAESIIRTSVEGWNWFKRRVEASIASRAVSTIDNIAYRLHFGLYQEPAFDLTEQFLKHFRSSRGEWDDSVFDSMAAEIVGQSLASLSQTRALTFHPLVHEWARSTLQGEHRQRLLGIASGLFLPLSYLADADSVALGLAYTFLPHIRNLIAMFQKDPAQIPLNFLMVLRNAMFLCQDWSHVHRIDILAMALAKDEPDDSPLSLNQRVRLIESLIATGSFLEAEKMAIDAVQKIDNNPELGPQHDFTIDTLENLTTMLSAQGRLHESIEIQWKVLDARIASFHSEEKTLLAIGNLGSMLREAGDYRASEALLLTSFVLRYNMWARTRLYEIPLLTSCDSLGLVCADLNRSEYSQSLFIKALRRYRALGLADIDLSISIATNLGLYFLVNNAYENAGMIFLCVSRQAKRVGGPAYQTLMARAHLAAARVKMGEIVAGLSQLKAARNGLSVTNYRTHYLNVSQTLCFALIEQGCLESARAAIRATYTNFQERGDYETFASRLVLLEETASELDQVIATGSSAFNFNDPSDSLENEHSAPPSPADDELAVQDAEHFMETEVLGNYDLFPDMEFPDLVSTGLAFRKDISDLLQSCNDPQSQLRKVYDYVKSTTEEEMAENVVSVNVDNSSG